MESSKDGITAGISGGGSAISTLGGKAVSTVTGSATVSIDNGLSVGIVGGGEAVSADATGLLGLVTDKSYGNDPDNEPETGYIDITDAQIENMIGKASGIPHMTITVSHANEGGTAEANVEGDVNVQLTGTTTAAGILGGGLAAAEHQYGVKYDSETKGQASGSSYAKTEVGGTTNILVDLTQAGKDYSADSFGEAVGADGVDLQKLAGQNVVIGLVGGSTAAAFGDANSRAEATSSDVNIDLRKGYVAGTFGGGIAIAAHDKVTQKADGDSQISATSDAGNINILVEKDAKAVGLFGNGLAVGMEYDDGYHTEASGWKVAENGKGNTEDDRNAVVSADSTNIVIDGGAADGVFGGGLALANGSYHGDSVTVETGTSYVTINNGTVDTFNFKTLKTSLQSVGAGIDKLLDTVSKDDSGDGPDDKPSVGEMLVGEKLNHYIDDLNNAADNLAVAGGSLAIGQGGYAHTDRFVYDLSGDDSQINGDIIAGGISDAVKVKSDDKNVGVVVDNAELNLAGGEVTGSVYVGGIKVTDSWETTGKVEDGAAYINGEMADSIVGTGTLNLAGTYVKGEISGAGYQYKNVDSKNKQLYGTDLGTSTLKLMGNNTLTTLGAAGENDNYTSTFKVHDFDALNAASGSVTALTDLSENGTAIFGNSDDSVETKVSIADDAYLDVSNISGKEDTDYKGQTYHVGENLGTLWSKDQLIYDRTQYFATTTGEDGAYDITFAELNDENKAEAAESLGKEIQAGPLQPTVDDLFDKGWDDETLTDGGKQFFEDWSNNPTMHEAYGRGAMIGEDAAVTGNTVSIARDMADNVMQRLSFTDDYVQDNGWVNNDGGIWAKYIHRKYETDNMGSSFGGIHSSTDYDGAIVGVDFKKDGKFQSGIAFHYGSGDGDGVISHNDYDAWGFTLYGSIKDEEAHTNLMVDVGYVTSDNDIDGTVNGKSMSADRDVDAWTIGLRGEKEYVFGQNQLVPYVGLRYMSVNPARYSVYYDGAKAFNADADNQNLWLLPIGVSFRNETVTDGGWRITPKLDLSYIWAFGDTDTDMTLDMGGVGSGLYYDVMDDNSWLASLGVEATKDVWSFGVGYGYQKGDDTKNKTWFVNASYAF